MGSDQSAVRSWQGSDLTADWSLSIWVRSFIESDLFDNYVPFDNTTPIYVINLPWKLGLGLDSELYYFSIFSQTITKTSTLSSANFMDNSASPKERTQMIKNKIKNTYSRSASATS